MNDLFNLLLLLIGYLIGSSNIGNWLHGSMTGDNDEVKK